MLQTKQIQAKNATINVTFWASKFHKRENPEDPKTALLEVSPLRNSKQIAAKIRQLITIAFTKILAVNQLNTIVQQNSAGLLPTQEIAKL